MSSLLTKITEEPQVAKPGYSSSALGKICAPQVVRPNISNRCSFCNRNEFPNPTIEMSPRIGIDKIAVEIPIATGMGDPVIFLSSIKNTMLGRWATKATTRHPGTGATIRWQFIKTRWSIRLEINPSRFIDPDGHSLASPSSTLKVVEELIREFMLESDDALPLFAVAENGEIDTENWRDSWTSMVRISRLDTTIDFQINSNKFDFEYYKQVRPKYAKGVQLTYGKNGKAETWNGIYSSRDGFVQMYDKSAQTKKMKSPIVPNCRITRFEYRLERKWLSRTHIHTLQDVNQTKFEYALKVGWNASKAGSVVNDPNSWEQRIHHSNLNRLEKLELIHFLRSGQNYSHEQESNHGEFDWIKLSKQAGISLSKPLSQQWHEAMFLDLETQSLIFI